MMNTIDRLNKIIQAIVTDHALHRHELQQSAYDLSISYRQQQFNLAVPEFKHALGYLAVRLPATYGVTRHVLDMINDNNIRSIVDIGTGPGTAIWAAMDRWPSVQHVTAFDANQHMLALAKMLHQKFAPETSITWTPQNFNEPTIISPADIVIMNYSLGEMSQADMTILMAQLYQATQKYIIIVEPGTSHGFAMIRRARSLLLALGAAVMAPCTHSQKCPMDQGDWCHFSERITRTALHRHTKRAELNYEDEKYSFIIMAKHPVPYDTAARLVKKPLQRSGHVRLDLCDHNGLSKKTYSRKDFDIYHQARRVMWGDLWNND